MNVVTLPSRGRGSRSINEIGNRYGRLLVVSFAGATVKYAMWLCKCDCGNDFVTCGRHLRSGATRSCGCYCREQSLAANSLPANVAALNKAKACIKHSATSRGIAWTIPPDLLLDLMFKDCHYCGSPPSNRKASPNGEVFYNGLDRVNNDAGYTPDNVVPCCAFCNHAKRDHSASEFLEWAARVHRHQQGIS